MSVEDGRIRRQKSTREDQYGPTWIFVLEGINWLGDTGKCPQLCLHFQLGSDNNSEYQRY